MSYYFLVEGKNTEMEMYPFWLKELRPDLNRVDKIEHLVNPLDYCIESGLGYPSIYKHIDRGVAKIEKSSVDLKRFIIIVDSEENTPSRREEHIKSHIIKKRYDNLSYQFDIIVQPISIESWFLGNLKIYSTKKDIELAIMRKFYDPKQKDPEELPLLEENIERTYSTRANFYFRMLRKLTLIKTRNKSTYSKSKVNYVKNLKYLNQMMNRCSTGDLKYFDKMVNLIKSI